MTTSREPRGCSSDLHADRRTTTIGGDGLEPRALASIETPEGTAAGHEVPCMKEIFETVRVLDEAKAPVRHEVFDFAGQTSTSFAEIEQAFVEDAVAAAQRVWRG